MPSDYQAQTMPLTQQDLGSMPGPDQAFPPAFQEAQQAPRPSDASDRNIVSLKDEKGFVAERVKEITDSERALGSWKTKLVKYYELYQMVQSEHCRIYGS